MSQFQGLVRQPRVALILGLVSLFVLILGFARLRTPAPAVKWIVHENEESPSEDASPLQKKLAEVYNTTLGFEKVFVVSMPGRLDHRDTVTLTSALTGFNVEFVDGVKVEDVPDKVMPPVVGEMLNGGAKGAWRAHMNTMREVVAKGYSSVLVAEDDFDWDYRLKDQLADFAVASTGILSQHSPDHVPHYGKFAGEFIEFSDLSSWLNGNQRTVRVPESPYGDGWDVLWLGNCNIRMDARDAAWQTLSVLRRDDPTTVPVNQYWALDKEPSYRAFSNQTRVYMSQPTDVVCSIAYAVSQQGARKLLFEVGLERADKPFDLMLQDFCQGGWKGGLAEPHACWGVMPSLFNSYVAAGRQDRNSEISTPGDASEFREIGYALNTQRSVRVNARAILNGDFDSIQDHYPYDEGTF